MSCAQDVPLAMAPILPGCPRNQVYQFTSVLGGSARIILHCNVLWEGRPSQLQTSVTTYVHFRYVCVKL
jgi:hypothetical protein